MSSPVLTIAESRSGPTASEKPRTSLAPPVPPARTTISRAIRAPRKTCLLPRRLGQARQTDARVDLVAGVHRYQQGGKRLRRARHLEGAAVNAAQAIDPFDQDGRVTLVLTGVAADQDVLPECVVQVGKR